VHQTIVKRLSQKNDKGLVLLYGKAGTGKTSYIRHLISKVKKKFIFLPPHLTKEIASPQLISILTEHPNSIFVIEDAENIIIDRDKKEDSPVTTLLNITDGLLSDCLNVQIICTFNTNVSNVDNALMRKGRLIAKYEFAELETDKAQALSDKLGFSSRINKPMTLAAIYHQNEDDYQHLKKRSAIGFIS
jgi:ATP-dependent 26S proteasome regulatory subunit